MKKNALASTVFISVAFLVACGDDGSTEKITQVIPDGVQTVSELDDLPKCTKENDGELMFVKGETSMRVCVDGKWYATAVSSTTSCSTKKLKDGSGVKIICDGDSVGVVLNGKDGADGKDGKNGAQGIQGEQGVQGEKGDAGTAGKDGVDGEGCSVVTLADNSGLKVLCGGDSVGVVLNGTDGADGTNGTDGTNGKDGTGCSMEKVENVLVRVICGKDTAVVWEADIIDTNAVAVDSEKIAISLDTVMGVVQKGPFLMGSKVTVREMEDGRTLAQTGNTFEGKIMNDNGEFKIKARMLVSQYVMLVVNGVYRNEVTGEHSASDINLFAITNVNDRNIVNVNLLTHLEYDRVVHLVTQEKMKVNAAKRQAQQEVLDLLHISSKNFSNSEDLNIAGSSDEDGALLAFSIVFLGDRSAAELLALLQEVSNDITADGTWDDAAVKMGMAEWSADADSSGRLETIRTNVANWGLSLMVPNFEKYIRHFWYTEYGLDSCNADSVGVVKAASAGKRKGTKTRYICKDMAGENNATNDFRWVIASDIEKDTYGWKDSTDGVLKTGDVTGKIYVFDKLGSFNGTAGWREAESIEKQHGGCVEALYDSIRTDKVYAYYYTCKKSTHTWVREVDYLIIDTQYWPDSSDGAVKWGDSVGVVDNLERICYVWDEAPQYNGWRTGNTSDCNLGLLGCTAKRGGEMRKSADGRYYSCSENNWVEITDEVYINTYLYRCTIDGEGERVYKDGDLVYGIEFTTTRYACENEQWRSTKPGEEQAGKACTVKLQGYILGDTITCDTLNWRTTIVYDYPVGKKWFNEDLEYGTLEDHRDGRVYRTIKIGNQVWMAENLAYADSIKNPYLKGQSWCYNDDSLNCLKGGRYYNWTAAMNIHYKWLDASPYEVEGLIGSPHQGICPDGWHLPTGDEWYELYDAVGTTPYAIQAKGQRLWSDATNESGFTALSTGYLYVYCPNFDYCGGFFEDVGLTTHFAGALEDDRQDNFLGWGVTKYQADRYGNRKWSGFSVRCVQDASAE